MKIALIVSMLLLSGCATVMTGPPRPMLFEQHNRPMVTRLNPWFFGNIPLFLFGFVPGFCGIVVDAADGAMWIHE